MEAKEAPNNSLYTRKAKGGMIMKVDSNLKSTKRKRIVIGGTLAVVISLGTIGYKLTDRYLIEHVEQVVVNTETSDSIQETSAITQDTSTTTTTNMNLVEATSTAEAISEDNHYKSDDMEITITKVEEGSGSDKITYYVADVVLSNSNQLSTAFAKDKVGQNIIEVTSTIAERNNAIFAVNGDYYGFRADGITIRNGVAYRDDGTRVGFAVYEDGKLASYDEASTTAADLIAAGVTDTFSFGPVLVENGVALSGFDSFQVDTNMGNRKIDHANPRTGIGYISENHYVFIVVDGRLDNYSRGMTLDEFAATFEKLGCQSAYNLDGGGSSTMYFNGEVINRPSQDGVERGVSDIIYVTE